MMLSATHRLTDVIFKTVISKSGQTILQSNKEPTSAVHGTQHKQSDVILDLHQTEVWVI